MKFPEDRRLTACQELTDLAALLNKGAASLYAKAMLLAHPDPKRRRAATTRFGSQSGLRKLRMIRH